MVNPNPSRITNEMWRLWEERPNLSWKLGGFYANKRAYHNTVIANLADWPGNYSIRLPLDLVSYNRDKARAIDLTMTDIEMVKWTRRMKNSAENPADDRLAAVREFYGTLDNRTVFGLMKDDENGPWRRSSADSTHLWHGHCSIFTAFVNNWIKLAPLISVWSGQSLTDWSVNVNLPKLGDSGESVKYWQYVHNVTRKQVDPDSPLIEIDGDYGPASDAAFKDFWKKTGGTGSPPSYISGWLAMRYHRALAIVSAPAAPAPVSPFDDDFKAYVNQWLSENLKEGLKVSGTITGKAIL